MKGWAAKRFGADQRSTAALEFALITPFLILLALGAIEYAAAVRVQLATDRAARTVAELLAQHPFTTGASYAETVVTAASGTTPATTISTNYNVVTSAEMTDYATAGQDCFSGVGGSMTLSVDSIHFSSVGATTTATLGWDAAGTGGSDFATAQETGTLTASASYVAHTITPSNYTGLSDGVDNDSAILVTAKSTYTMPFLPSFSWQRGGATPTSFTFTATAIVRPRYSPILYAGW